MFKYFILLPIFLVLNIFLLNGQSVNSKGKLGQPVEIKNADSLVGVRIADEGEIRRYEGHVWFEQGNIVLRCGEAVHYTGGNSVDLSGNVEITQGEMRLRSPHIFYNGKTGIATSKDTITLFDKNTYLSARSGEYNTETQIVNFYGSVRIDADSVVIDCDTLEYSRLSLIAKAFGNVKIEDDSVIILSDKAEHRRTEKESHAVGMVNVIGKYNGITMTADTVFHKNMDNYTYCSGSPVLYMIENDSGNATELDSVYSENDSLTEKQSNMPASNKKIIRQDTLSISSNRIIAMRYAGEDRALFDGDAEIIRGNISARSAYAFYNKTKEYVFLKGPATVWYDSTQLHADSITIFMSKSKLKLIEGAGNAFSLTVTDTAHADLQSQLSGNEIRIIFENDSLRFIRTNGNSRSLYFTSPTDSSEGGGASASADSILISMEEGQLDRIDWIGGVQGKYIPESMILANPKEYYLPGYRCSYDKPRRKPLLLR
jgi:lipopolysaccharide export system protein LptA